MGSEVQIAVIISYEARSLRYVVAVARSMEDTFPEGRRGGDKGPLAARGSAGSFHHQTSNLTSTPPHPTRRAHLVTTGKMAEPIVQTIHRDPALLYVLCLARSDAAPY